MTEAETGTVVERVLVGCTGALQMLSIGDYIAAMRSVGIRRIGVVLSPSAAAMTSPASLEAIVNEVFIELPMTRNRLVVVPATANFLASAATGGARNGVELMLIAMPTPSVIVPAMNGVMWSKPAIQRNILALKEDGHTVLAPQEREVYEAASKDFRSGVAASTPYEVANAVREISDATAGSW